MTRAYHDIEAVTRLLEEKEKDLELAAKIGQELLERNRFLEDKVGQLEAQLSASMELMTQLRHELQTKTDLLRAYNDDDFVDDASPLEMRNINVDLLQKKILDLQVDNKKLQEVATVLAHEAIEVEEKEEKLVSETVKHLTEANVQISYLSEEFSNKSNESRKQKEEITHLLAQICNLQAKSKTFGHDNEDLRSSLCVYKETQEELTAELSDFKEKYREVVDLLHDAQEDLRQARRKSYAGLGQHSIAGMFGDRGDGDHEIADEFSSLQSEIHSSLRSSKRASKKHSLHSSRFDSDDSDHDRPRSRADLAFSAFSRTFDTYRIATANSKMIHAASGTSPVSVAQGSRPGQGSSLRHSLDRSTAGDGFEFQTYMPATTDMSDSCEREFHGGALGSDITTDLGDGRVLGGHPGLGSLPATSVHTLMSPRRGQSDIAAFSQGWNGQKPAHSEEVLAVQTIGELRRPQISLAPLSTPLGSVPSMKKPDFEPVHYGEFKISGSVSSLPADSSPYSGPLDHLPLRLGSLPNAAEARPYSLSNASSVQRPQTQDSGVMSNDFYDNNLLMTKSVESLGDRRSLANIADGRADDDKFGEYREGGGGDVHHEFGKRSYELEKALQQLNPVDVERHRRQMSGTYSYDLGSDGFDSPGSLLGKPGFNFLPYGIRTPDSIMSTGSRCFSGSLAGSSGYGAGWKLPDKLRIIKPLEGSLTLHQWQKLAMPHLGNLLEERSGVAVKGATIKEAMEDFALSEMDEDECDSLSVYVKQEDTRTLPTFTDCTVLHPDDAPASTLLTSSYSRVQMSSGFEELSRSSSRMSSQSASRLSSRRQSVSAECNPYRQRGTLTFSSSIGLARVLNERHIHGYLSTSNLSLNNLTNSDYAGSLCSLTPSIISTPAGDRSFSPTGTPLNSPIHTPPGTPPNEKRGSGMVLGFFASLKSALYGEQQKEAHTLLQKRKKSFKKFGILERVEEVGVENLMCASPSLSKTLGYAAQDSFKSSESMEDLDLPNFDSRFLSNLTVDDKDELEEITPGSLTFSGNQHSWGQDPTIGQLSAPTFSLYGRPSLSPGDLGRVPKGSSGDAVGDAGAVVGGRGPGRVITSPGETRYLGALGVPGTPGTGALRMQGPAAAAAGKYAMRPDLGTVPLTKSPESETKSGFIGNITSMFFGRKGGLL